MINEDNTTQDIVYDDNQLFSILKLSELNGTNAVHAQRVFNVITKLFMLFRIF